MFSCQMKRLFYNSACFFSRQRRRGKNANVGLDNQLKGFQKDLNVFNADPEGFEDIETTLLEANKSHREYEQEIQHQRDKIRRFIVKRKYFATDPMPNFLTYAEKERIRMLWNGNDSEEWTSERLAESFPALPTAIQKIANSNWTPLTNKRIIKHDAQVVKNWKLLKDGEYRDLLPKDLVDHLAKFIDRTEIRTDQSTAEKYLKSKQIVEIPKATEFQSILGDNNHSSNSFTIENQSKNSNNLTENMFKDKIDKKSLTTNKNLMDKPLMRLKDFREISIDGTMEKSVQLSTTKHLSGWNSESDLENVVNWNGFPTGRKPVEITFSVADLKTYEINTIKQRICIPRKLWQRGALYRIEDCYYDDDGEFLYRVIGMNGGGQKS